MKGQVCASCGISANVLTCLKKYGMPPKKLCFDISTFHVGICACCGEAGRVTETRDFYDPSFELIKEVTDFLCKKNGKK